MPDSLDSAHFGSNALQVIAQALLGVATKLTLTMKIDHVMRDFHGL
ncbi:hypothetical protein [Limnohabitans sp. 2KL-51]|nr:hypothetical protein [Limnohabitans sp. 2KL-51]